MFAQKTIYHIGDVIQFRDGSMGVVCYVNPDNPQEGWVMDLIDVPADENNPSVAGKFALYTGGTLPFQRQHSQAENGYDILNWTPEGLANTTILDQTGSSPLMQNPYVSKRHHNQWYIPDIMQMSQMFYLSPMLKDSVEAYGGYVVLTSSGSVSEMEYWTSSAISNKKVQSFYFSSGHMPPEGDVPSTSSERFVRLVRDFKVGEAIAYWLESDDTTRNDMWVYAPSTEDHFRGPADTTFHAVIVYGDSVFAVDPSVVHMHPVYVYQEGDNRDIPVECVCQQTAHYKKYGFDIDISQPTSDYVLHERWDLTKKYECDSLIKLYLRVDPVYEFHDTVVICESDLPSFRWKEDRAYEGTTVDSIMYKTKIGCHCDSVWWLHLFVAPTPKPTITIDGSICQNENFTLTASNEYCFNAVPLYEERFNRVSVTNGTELENDAGNKPVHKIDPMTLFKEGNYVKWYANDKAISVGAAGTEDNRRWGVIYTDPLDLPDPFVLNLTLRGWGRPSTATETPATRVVVIVKSADGTEQYDSITVPGYITGTNDAQYYEDYRVRFDGAGDNAVITLKAIDEPQVNPATGQPFEYADQRFYMKYFSVNKSDCDIRWYDLAAHELGEGEVLAITTSHDSTVVALATSRNGSETGYVECPARDTATVRVINPTVTVNSPNVTVCEGNDIVLEASVNVTNVQQELIDGAQVNYHWTGPQGYSSDKQNDTISLATTNKAGGYTVTVQVDLADELCVVESGKQIDVAVNLTPAQPRLHAEKNTGCSVANGSITVLEPTGPSYSYSINNGVTFQTENVFQNLETGQYTVIVMNEDGCVNENTVDVGTSSITLSVSANAESPCQGGDIELTATATVSTTAVNLEYAWSGPNQYTSELQNPTIHDANSDMDGRYTVTVTETNTGCTATASADVAVKLPLTGDTTATACETFNWYEHTNLTVSSNNLTHTFTSVEGCDSVVTLNLTINHGTHDVETQEVCDSVKWHGTTYTESGIYTYIYNNSLGCPSADTLKVTINHSNTGVDTQVACETFIWIDGKTYTESTNTPTYTLTNAAGCDSVVTLHLTVNHGTHNVETQIACESYEWHGTTYTESGTYTYPYTNEDGCSSVDTLKLTVNYGTHNVETETACESYEWHGTTYRESGTYTYPYTNAAGCPSVDTLKLTVNYGTHNVETQIACESFEWHGTIYRESGTYTYPYTNAAGCASVDTLKLTIHYGTHNVVTDTACESYVWHNVTYTTSDTYTYAYTNADGCASVDTLHLTINNPVHTGISHEQCGGTYTWERVDGTDTTITASGTYLYRHLDANNCTQVDTLHLTINPLPANPEFSIVDNPSCIATQKEGSFTVTSPTGSDYIYSFNDGPFQTVRTFTGLGEGTYTITVKNQYGCTSTGQATVHDIGSTVKATATAESPCLGDTIKLRVTTNVTGVSYIWSGPSGFQSTSQNPNRRNATAAMNGTYTVIVTQTSTGCKDTAYAEVAVKLPTYYDTVATACESFTWRGVTYTETPATAPTDTLTNAVGCDSVVTLRLTIYKPEHASFTVERCGSYTWTDGDGETYTTSGDHTYSHLDAHGCTQVDTLHLTINNPVHTALTVEECESYTWKRESGTDTVITDSGDYLYRHQDAHGCTQVDTLHLTINNPVHTALTVENCESYTWERVGGTDTVITDSGDYLYRHSDAHGCTQVDTLHLTINNPVHTAITVVECESYTWERTGGTDTVITESGDYLYRHSDAHGCTQVDTLHLTINNPVHTAITVAVCDSYTWERVGGTDTVITDSGDYLYRHLDDNTCTQVDTLHLTIYPKPVVPTLTVVNNTSCQAPNGSITVTAPIGSEYSYSLNGGTYQSSPIFTGQGAGDYIITVKNSHDCTNKNTASISTIGSTVTASADAVSPCPGGDIELTATTETSGVTFAWTGPANFSSTDQNPTRGNATSAMNGTYTVTVTETATSCTATATTEVAVKLPTTGDTTATACETFSWYEHTNITQSTETLTHTFQNANVAGCDSVVTLHLTINNPVHTALTVEKCESYTWERVGGTDTVITDSGDYTYGHEDDNHCWQVDTLHLTINNPVHTALTVEKCESYTWVREGGTDTVITDSGDYLYRHSDAHGCTQVDTLHLTINNPVHRAITVEECESYTWETGNGETYTTSNTYTYSHLDSHGCTQVDTLHLTINNPVHTALTVEKCES